VIDAAKGLTQSEAENACSLSLVRHVTLKAETLWEIKAGQLKKSGLASIHRGTESFQQLGGLDNLKAFCLRAMRRQSEGTVSNRPRGVLLRNRQANCSARCRRSARLFGGPVGEQHPGGTETGRRDGSVRLILRRDRGGLVVGCGEWCGSRGRIERSGSEQAAFSGIGGISRLSGGY
jgi:hypothetical protein